MALSKLIPPHISLIFCELRHARLAKSRVAVARQLRVAFSPADPVPFGLLPLPDSERFLVERFGFGVLAHRLVQQGQVVEASRRFDTFWPKDFLSDSERFPVERFGFSVLAHCPVELGQAIEALRCVGMFVSENLLADPERFLKKRLGFGVLAHCLIELGQVIEGESRLGMVRAAQAPCYFNGLFRQRNSLLIISFCIQPVNSLIERLEVIILRQGC